MVCGASACVVPAAREVRLVLRHRRVLPSVALTVMGRSEKFAMYMVPVRLFSGFDAPFATEANRGSRHVPVQVGDGSILPAGTAQVSLYETRVRYAVAEVSI